MNTISDKIDSLENEIMQLHENDTLRFELYQKLVNQTLYSHPELTRKYAQELLYLGGIHQRKEFIRAGYNYLCINHAVLSEFDNDRQTLQLLEHLPVKMIKLRPGLAKGLSANTSNQEIIRAVVRAVESRNITIIADEVQDASDLAALWQCGVKLVTGDFLNEAPQVVGQ